MPIKNLFRNEQARTMSKKEKTTFLDERIEQFCKSSGDLLADINDKYNSPKKSRKKKKEVLAVPDRDIEHVDTEPLEDLL